MYVKKFASFRQVPKKMHRKENRFLFFLRHSVELVAPSVGRRPAVD